MTYREEAADEYSQHRDKVIIESRDKSRNPTLKIMKDKVELKQYNLPVGAHIMANENQQIKAGDILVKIQGRLENQGISQAVFPVTELFEARNPPTRPLCRKLTAKCMGRIKGTRSYVPNPVKKRNISYPCPNRSWYRKTIM